MGKGDKKTKRGKLFQGSYGARRRRKAKKATIIPRPVDVIETDPVDVKEVKDVKSVKKTTKPAPVAKKETKPKKSES